MPAERRPQAPPTAKVTMTSQGSQMPNLLTTTWPTSDTREEEMPMTRDIQGSTMMAHEEIATSATMAPFKARYPTLSILRSEQVRIKVRLPAPPAMAVVTIPLAVALRRKEGSSWGWNPLLKEKLPNQKLSTPRRWAIALTGSSSYSTVLSTNRWSFPPRKVVATIQAHPPTMYTTPAPATSSRPLDWLE
eukprot:629513-Hanusia_phi.AAC.1